MKLPLALQHHCITERGEGRHNQYQWNIEREREREDKSEIIADMFY